MVFWFCKNSWPWYNLNAMEILNFLSSLKTKDGLLAVSLVVLLACLFKIRKLKDLISKDSPRRLLPFFSLELALKSGAGKNGFYLANESFFLAKNIKIEDLEIFLDDLGYPLNVVLRFAEVEWLKAKERVKLDLKVFDQKGEYLAQVTEKIIPHLAGPSFRINLRYENIEGAKFNTRFKKNGTRITSAEITATKALSKKDN